MRTTILIFPINRTTSTQDTPKTAPEPNLFPAFAFPRLILGASVEEDVLKKRVAVEVAEQLDPLFGDVVEKLKEAFGVEDGRMQVGRRR